MKSRELLNLSSTLWNSTVTSDDIQKPINAPPDRFKTFTSVLQREIPPTPPRKLLMLEIQIQFTDEFHPGSRGGSVGSHSCVPSFPTSAYPMLWMPSITFAQSPHQVLFGPISVRETNSR